MSDEIKAAETEPADDVKTDSTLVTTDQPEVKEGGPAPLYEDKADDKVVEEKEDEKKEEVKDESDKDEADTEKADGDDKEYDSLDAPDDSLLNDADMERILARAKEEGLSKEAAQKYVDIAQETLKENQSSLDQAHSDLSEQWVDNAKADKEIGGEKFEESVSMANKALKKFGTEDLFKSLDETKFGNNPEVVRVFARIGKAMSPDSLQVSENHMKTEKTLEEKFYPNDIN